MQADIIIVGAGAAGLMAAKVASATGKKVVVLEARDRIGGRVHTITDASFSQPVESGAEFVHGNLDLTLQLLKEAAIQTLPAEGKVWRSKEGRLFQQDDFIENADVLMQALEKQQSESSVGDFLALHLGDTRYGDLKKSVQGYVEGYYAGTLDKASVLALKEEWQNEEEPQRRISGGYTKLMQVLYKACVANGAAFYFDSPVKTIAWAFEKVEAITQTGRQFSAKKIMLTVPSPVLLNSDLKSMIGFQPQVTEQINAFRKLGYGSVIKILVEFKTAFWQEPFNLNGLGFLFSEEVIPTWWTQHPQQANLLTGWCAGPQADTLKGKTDAQLFQKSIQSLAHIFNLPALQIENSITAWKVCNWAADPFTWGGYSYITTTTKEALTVLSQPVENTIYFAGEALYDSINVGTVEAAFKSGKQVAEKMIASFIK